EIIEKIGDADLIIFSPGSLYTSILPHLIAPEVRASRRQRHRMGREPE
ncbi:MAG: YvcK family protein, partial [Muribaculaceae bacterium]|nr:YvcK family protein [Muribaculaceae bacterium]